MEIVIRKAKELLEGLGVPTKGFDPAANAQHARLVSLLSDPALEYVGDYKGLEEYYTEGDLPEADVHCSRDANGYQTDADAPITAIFSMNIVAVQLEGCIYLIFRPKQRS